MGALRVDAWVHCVWWLVWLVPTPLAPPSPRRAESHGSGGGVDGATRDLADELSRVSMTDGGPESLEDDMEDGQGD